MAAILCPVSPASYPDLAAFLSAFPGETGDREYWIRRFRHWWDSNPAFVNGLERGWMLEDGRAIVGFIGSIPTRFRLAGQDAIVVNTTTWRVVPGFRRQSLSLLGRQIESAEGTVLFNTTPNNVVETILQGMRFDRLPRDVPDSQLRQVLVTGDARKVLCHKLKGLRGGQTFAVLGGPVLAGLQRLRFRPPNGLERFEVRTVSFADESFDDLWERTRNRFANTNVRTSEVINWSCFGSSDMAQQLFAAYLDGRLYGYLNARTFESDGLRILETLDLWHDPAEARTIGALLLHAKRYAELHGIDVFVFYNYSQEIAACVRALGLYKIPHDSRQYFRLGAKVTAPISSENSYFVSWQGDYAL